MAAIPFSDTNMCMRLSDFARPQVVQETSIVAYHEGMKDGVLGEQAGRVYEALRAAPDGLTNEEISRSTGIRINAVCGRVYELRDRERCPGGKALVVCGGKRLNPRTKKQNMVWVVAR